MFKICSGRDVDEEESDSTFTPIELTVRRILNASGLRNLMLTNRVVKAVRTQLAKMKNIAKKAMKAGGNTFRLLMEKWKSNEDKYRIKVYFSEMDVNYYITDNKRLRSLKRKYREQFQQEREKREKLERNLERSEKTWKKKFKNVVNKLRKMKLKEKKKKPTKIFSSYSARHQDRLKSQFKSECQAALSFLGLYELVPTKVKYFNFEEQRFDTLSLIDDDEYIPIIHTDKTSLILTNEEIDMATHLLYIKDKFHVSDEAWKELSAASEDFPSIYSIKKRMETLNERWNLFPTPGEAEGVQIRLKDSLMEQIPKIEHKFGSSKNLKIKVSGDGTNIGKRLHILNVTYTIINEESAAMSEKGNYVLAIIKTTEEYNSIRDSLSDLIEEMRILKSVEVNGVEYELEYFLGGDWKFLACVCGIGCANQDYACIWCKCPRVHRWDTSKKWSIKDTALGARTVKEITEHSRKKQFNCKYSPLFDFIPMDHVVIDTLHLFLRISDVLISLLILELRTQDCIGRKQTFPKGFAREKYNHMASYETFIRSLGIRFEWSVNKDTKQLTYRDLTGPEKLILFEKIKITELLPNFEKSVEISNLWSDFIDLIGDLKLSYTSKEDIEKFDEKIKMWINNFNSLYQTSDVTPYMHAFSQHIAEFLELYINVSNFNQQGMEKFNDTSSKDYFRSTSHRNSEALKQIMLKKQRVQLLEAMGCERLKRSYCCRNCSQSGHSIKKCTEKCDNCDVLICCSHLVKINGTWIQQCKQ